jgi:hypothetical protein
MSIAEMFLMVWALGATCIAVYFQHKFKHAYGDVMALVAMLIGIAAGTTKMEKKAGHAVFTNSLNGEITDEVHIETRQG